MIFYKILDWLLDLANKAADMLPEHTPIEFPDLGGWFALFHGLGTVNRLFPLWAFFLVLGLIAIVEIAVGIYIVYRLVVKLIPLP